MILTDGNGHTQSTRTRARERKQLIKSHAVKLSHLTWDGHKNKIKQSPVREREREIDNDKPRTMTHA